MNEYETQLPQGWDLVKFGDIIKVQGGYAFKAKEFTNSGVPVVRIGDLQDGEVRISDKTAFLPTQRWGEYPSFHLRKGDILIALSGATTGKIAIYNMESPALLNQRVGRFIPNYPDDIHDGFLWVLIRKVSEGVLDQAWGGAQPNVSPTVIENNTIFLPPLPEQKRIAQKIEALQTRSSKVRKALDAIPSLLERFRQSVLSSAFKGDLTADWRAHNPDIEPAEKLLERIRKERRKRWEEDELAKMKAKGKMPKDDKWKDKYKEPEPVDTSDLPELPVGWCWAALEELGDWFGGGTPSKSVLSYWTNGTIPWVSPKDMKLPVIMETVDYITEKALQDSTSNLLPEGSILIVTRSGILRRTLPVALAGVDLSINQDLKGLKLEEGLRPVYVFEALNSLADSIREQCAKAGTTVESIIFESLLRFPIPIAPEKEQAIIAKKLKEVNQKVETVKSNCASSSLQLTQLDQSILSKAFRGELVPQDPNDESASVLLERIRREKARQAEDQKAKPKQIGQKMKKPKAKQQDILSILQQTARAMTPEELFAAGGFDEESVDAFYDQLRTALTAKQVREERKDADVRLEAIK